MKERALQPEKIKSVVVRSTNWVGDAVMTIPALKELRRILPEAHITLATREWAQGLFADADDFLDDLLIQERTKPSDVRAVFRQIKEWRRRKFDLAILFPNAFEAAFIAASARIPLRTGYATEGRRALLTHPVELPAWRDQKHEVYYYLNIVHEMERTLYGTTSNNVPSCLLTVSDQRQQEAREMLDAFEVRPAHPLITLCPGSTNSRAKRWPAERYSALADRLIDETNAQVILIGSKDELSVSHEVAQAMRHEPIMLTGQTDLAQLVAILSLTDLLITNDTGPAHIAAALDRPTLVIFGPTNPVTTRPFSQSAEIIRRPPECAPCMLRDCPIDHRCMTAITPDEVFESALRLMKHDVAEVRA